MLFIQSKYHGKPVIVHDVNSKHKQDIPIIARFQWGSVGKNDTEYVEKQLGKGLIITGGHPKGARVWKYKHGNCYLYMDGFDWDNNRSGYHGYVVYDLQICREMAEGWRGKNIPTIKTKTNPCLFLDSIGLGMKRKTVLSILHNHKLTYSAPQSDIVIASKGYNNVNSSTTYRKWTARLVFKSNALDCIQIQCD